MATVYADSVAPSAPNISYIPAGGGADGGLLSTVLLLSLLGGGAGLGGRKDCVDQASLNALQGSIDIAAVMAKLGSIEAAVPYNEAQVQLALAGLSDQLTRTITNGQTSLLQGQANLQLGQCNTQAALTAAITNSAAQLQSALTAVDTNIDHSTTTITNAVNASETRLANLITQNVIQDLRDKVLIATNENAELRGESRRDRDRHGLEITMIQNQNQQQQQQQAVFNKFDRMESMMFDTIQSVRATNQAINIGAGTQTANPLNTNTNVRA